jgi:hypothetical protein
MKKYTELSAGKWIVSGEGENDMNEFLLVPRMKGSTASGMPTLVCDSPAVITAWNGSGFIVKIPEASSTYNFTLMWGKLVRVFEFIVSENLLDDVSALQGEITALQGVNGELTNEIQDTNSKIDTFKASTLSNCNEIKASLDNTASSLNNQIDTARSNYVGSAHNVKNLFVALKNTMEQLRDSRASNAVDIRKQAEIYANSTALGLMQMYSQLTTTAALVDREAIMYAYFLDNFINQGVDALNNLFSDLQNEFPHGVEFSSVKQILDTIVRNCSNLNTYSNNQGHEDSANLPSIDDFELQELIRQFVSFPWMIFDLQKNVSNNWCSNLSMHHPVWQPSGETRMVNIAFDEEFLDNVSHTLVKVNDSPLSSNTPLSIDVTSNMLRNAIGEITLIDGNFPRFAIDLTSRMMVDASGYYVVVRGVKNAGMPQDIASRIIPLNATVINFYREDNGTLKYYDRIFLNPEIVGIYSALQIGESAPYECRHMPSKWDNFSVPDPGNIKINIKRTGESEWLVYYCDDNVEVNVGTLFTFTNNDWLI